MSQKSHLNNSIMYLCIVLLLLQYLHSFRVIHRSFHQPFQLSVKSQDNLITSRKNVNVLEIASSNTNINQFRKYLKKPEVLAPAGGWAQLKAAANNGADAVYFGLEEGFNARARASNFKLNELSEVMQYLHERTMKGYLTINVLIYDKELIEFEKIIKGVTEAGVDALIMQDIGAVSYIRRLAPNLPIHGSTQMSITDTHGSLYAGSLGIDRVVVGRELSLHEIKTIHTQLTSYSEQHRDNAPIEIEAFVHGALCVSYSGQCYSSEAWGGRSANRGQCAQACRMPYGFIVNGSLTELYQDVQYLLSPQDLMAIDYVPQLIDAGVSSFKIEGRLKGPEYVAITTKAYREAIDRIWNNYETAILTQKQQQQQQQQQQQKLSSLDTNSVKSSTVSISSSTSISTSISDSISITDLPYQGPEEALRLDLAQVFSRGQNEQYDGLSTGFLQGVRHQSLVRGNAPRHRGVYLGKVVGINTKQNGIYVSLAGPIKRGDGIVFDHGKPEEKEEGGLVYEIFQNNHSLEKGQILSEGKVLLTFGYNAIDIHRISIGDLVWRSKDATLDQRLKTLIETPQLSSFVPVVVQVSGVLGKPLTLTLSIKPETLETKLASSSTHQLHSRSETNDDQISVTVQTTSILTPALQKGLTKDSIQKAIGQLGGTSYHIENTDTDIDISQLQNDVFVPVSEIKEARRNAVSQLISKQIQHNRNEGLRVGQNVLSNMVKESAIIVKQIETKQQLQQQQQISDQKDASTASTTTTSIASGGDTSNVGNIGNGNLISTTTASKKTKKSKKTSQEIPVTMEQNSDKIHDNDNVINSLIVPHSDTINTPKITLLCRTPMQVMAACQIDTIQDIILDFLEVHGVRDAVRLVQSHHKKAIVAMPRIIKPDEEKLVNFYIRLKPDGILVRSAGVLQQLNTLGGPGAFSTTINATIPLLYGDFSLNAANAIAYSTLLSTGQLTRLTPTHDLNADQLVQMQHLIQSQSSMEIILHQHLAIFHTEHCVFCRFLSTGDNYTNCGHPCETNHIALRSMEGEDHLVLADQGCRNTVFNAQAQTGAEYIPQFLSAGIRHYRIELVDESAEYVAPLVQAYEKLIYTAYDNIKPIITPTTTLTTTSASSISRGNNIDMTESNNSNQPQKLKRKKQIDSSTATITTTTTTTTSTTSTSIDTNNDDNTINKDTTHIKKKIISYDKELSLFYQYLNTVPNQYGRTFGYSTGSLKPIQEIEWKTMKPTAYQQ